MIIRASFNMKNKILKIFRRKVFQGLWEQLFHVSKIGMNYWGGASLSQSGELYALHYINNRLMDIDDGGMQNLIFFDVGANRGQYALALMKTIITPKKKIYSFEPSAETYRLLQRNIRNHNLEDSVKACHLGFSDKEGSSFLYSPGIGSTIASVHNLKAPLTPYKDEFTESIQIMTIDRFCQQRHIEKIDLLKIDIEGHEYQALLGAQRMIQAGRVRFIQFEFGECHIDARTFFRDFYELLSDRYKLYRIVSNGLREIKGYNTDLEVFSTMNYLAELKL